MLALLLHFVLMMAVWNVIELNRLHSYKYNEIYHIENIEAFPTEIYNERHKNVQNQYKK